MNSMVKVLGLEAKRKARSSTLSGGQKRKLSVGIAVIADSKVIRYTLITNKNEPHVTSENGPRKGSLRHVR